MGITYFKRFRMEIDLRSDLFQPSDLPVNYSLIPWHELLLEDHADAKFRSFRTEIDANVFPCLGEREGCYKLMHDIVNRKAFVSDATWLLRYECPDSGRSESCGTVQGVRDKRGHGSIQNLGIVPSHRDRGLGSCLLFAALNGFMEAGIQRVNLEVTAQNAGAVRLYRRLGFRRVKTVYKAAEVAYA